MDFLWFWVSVAISVEVVRQSVQQCYPKKKSKSSDDSLKEPILVSDGSCPYSCCVKEIESYETYDAGSDTAESSDEIGSDEIRSDEIVSEEIVSEELEEEYTESTESVTGTRNGTDSDKDVWTQEIVGRIYPAGPGRPKLVHFKVSEIGGATTLRKESSVRIHPQLNGEAADQAHSSVGTSSSKDKPSEEFRVSPPRQEVMSAECGNIPGGGDGQCSDPVE